MLALFLLFFESLVIESIHDFRLALRGIPVSISELRVLLLRVACFRISVASSIESFNLRIESLVIES